MKKNGYRGFSLLETLITLAVLGVIASISISLLGNVNQNVKDQKLRSDVGTLNRAVQIYTSNGGSMADVETPEEVLAKLRSVAEQSMSFRLPGLSSSLVDPRVAAKLQTRDEADGNGLRAFWDSHSSGFKLANSGARGIKEFVLDESQSELIGASEDRKAHLLFASTDGWVWDYKEEPIKVRTGPTAVVTNFVPGGLPSGGPSAPTSISPKGVLRIPLFSIPGGSYPFKRFDLMVELTNPNPAGTSDLYFGVDGGPLSLYVGSIPVSPGAVIDAKAVSKVPSYVDSARVSKKYSADALTLLPPVITPNRDRFSLFSQSSIAVTLSESNERETANIQYRLNGGPWIAYLGVFVLQEGELHGNVTIEAQSISAGSTYYLPSEIVKRDLGSESLAFSGAADGRFSNPVGGKMMVTNLSPHTLSSNFKWGNVTGLGHSQSRLQFYGGAFVGTSPGKRFKLGEMTYYNGTIQSGTGANTVDLALNLNLDVSGHVLNPKFNFTFELVNTPNGGNDPWQAADFVRISSPRSSQILVIDGYQFEFRLEFGETTEDGFAEFDQFHVLEESDARVNVYGTFVNVGPVTTAP